MPYRDISAQEIIRSMINAVLIVGTIVRGFDHYALEPDGAGCKVTGWNDDPETSANPFAEVWKYLPPARDAKLDGAYNTRLSLNVYVDTPRAEKVYSCPGQRPGPDGGMECVPRDRDRIRFS